VTKNKYTFEKYNETEIEKHFQKNIKIPKMIKFNKKKQILFKNWKTKYTGVKSNHLKEFKNVTDLEKYIFDDGFSINVNEYFLHLNNCVNSSLFLDPYNNSEIIRSQIINCQLNNDLIQNLINELKKLNYRNIILVFYF
jgi:hypothetical protein